MKSTELSLQEYRTILEYEDNFPIRVTVDGETREADAAFLRDLRGRRVHFDLDDAQVSQIFTKHGTC